MNYGIEAGLKNIVILTPQEIEANAAFENSEVNRKELEKEIANTRDPKLKAILQGELDKLGNPNKAWSPFEQFINDVAKKAWTPRIDDEGNYKGEEEPQWLSGAKGFIASSGLFVFGAVLIVLALVISGPGKSIAKKAITKGLA